MTKKIILLAAVLLVVAGGVVVVKQLWLTPDKHSKTTRVEPKLKNVKVSELGVTFSIPVTYQRRANTSTQLVQTDIKPAINFERTSPQGLFTIRSESGLAIAANALKSSLIDYIDTSIRQFFPVRYKNYKSISLERIKVHGFDAIQHRYTYTDQDGKQVYVRLIVVPSGNNTAFYLILQASQVNYPKVQADLDWVRDSFTIL